MSTKASPFSRKINWLALLKFSDLDEEIRSHLKTVYLTLAFSVALAALGSFLHTLWHIGGITTSLIGLGIIIGLYFVPFHPGQPQTIRLGMLAAFSVVQGASVGPLIEMVLTEIPNGAQTVTVAFLATVIVFGCFSLMALLSPRRSWLYLGGFLMSCLFNLLLFGCLNIFLGSSFLFSIELNLGLLLFVGFVIFDTQLIVEKAAAGNKDYVLHALELFLDFLNIFVRLLIILAKKNKSSKDFQIDLESGSSSFKTEL